MAKKPDDSISKEEEALEEHVDDMMSVERKDDDISRLAEDFNKQALGDKPAEVFEDQDTEKAVDDIVAKEGDTLLAVDDARAKKRAGLAKAKGWKAKLRVIAKDKRTWAAVAVLLVIIFALPVTRYKILGLFIKKDVTITIVDSKTSSPVSSAEVSLGGDSAKTDAEGHAKLHSSVGSRTLTVSKNYYNDLSKKYFVGFGSSAGGNVKFVATGRLVPVTVTNKVTGKPLVGAQVAVKGTTAKTNNKGQAEIALPVKASTYTGKVSLWGYNSIDITVQVTDKAVKANSFGLVPEGHIYFLSNLDGTINVVKSNLDGSGRKTVLEGSGHEDAASTSLLASRDWKYVALKARHDGDKASLYLIDTSNDKVTTFDDSGADFELIGWYGHNFIYSLTKDDPSYWQAGRQQVKSYDADHLQLNQLDQTLAEGNQNSYAYQTFLNFYILNGVVTYNTQWYDSYAYDMAAKSNTIRAVQPNGQSKKDYQSLPAGTSSYVQAALYEPQAVYYGVYTNGNSQTTYYEFENLTVKPVTLTQTDFNNGYPTYLLSPSGGKTFWSELRDGKNGLFVGDANAGGKKQIAALSGYTPYGWYGEDYVLVSKNASELYIMTPTASNNPPLKVTDYYKPSQTYRGYGYGYGGL
jgi:hypothetical protein